jgi:hypothetical protein
MYLYLLYGEPAHRMLTSSSISGTASKPGKAVDGGRRTRTRPLFLLIQRASVDDLEKAFGWNLQGSSAFKDMKAEAMSSNIYSKSLMRLQTWWSSLHRKYPWRRGTTDELIRTK